MDSKNIWKYQAAIITFLIIFIFFVPIPKLASLSLLWIIILLSVHILSGCWYFSFFLSLIVIIIIFVFLLIKSRNDNLEFRQAFIENFANKMDELKNDDDEPKNVPMLVGELNNVQEKIDEAINKPNPIELKETPKPLPPIEKKISMMEKDSNIEDDFFGKLNVDDFEESDEDTEEDEKELEKNVGKTKTSSKNAYKAQKQLYDLTVAVSKLHDNMEKIAPTLKKGQKIIESLGSLGLDMN